MDQQALVEFLTLAFPEENFFQQLNEAIAATAIPLRPVGSAFRDNLQSVIATVFLPSRLAMAMLGKLEALKPEERRDRLLVEIANASLLSPAAELLRQGTVLTWSALEVLANDLFTELLNQVPDLVDNLAKSDPTRNAFQLKNVTFETLAKFGYDISQKMGLVLLERRSVDSAMMLREVFQVLVPEDELLQVLLRDDRLWLLHQRRNLIVHRRAVVDRSYLANTADYVEQGTRLEVKVSDIRTDLELVRNIGMQLLKTLPRRLRPVPAE